MIARNPQTVCVRNHVHLVGIPKACKILAVAKMIITRDCSATPLLVRQVDQKYNLNFTLCTRLATCE